MRAEQTVLQAKRLGVFHCRQTDSLGDAARWMVEEDISALVVVDDDGFLRGILTRVDLLRAFQSQEDWAEATVSQYMNPEVVTVQTGTRLDEVAEILLDRKIHRVVVASEETGQKRPVSVVSAADLVYHMVKGI